MDDEKDLERQWWAHPVTKRLYDSLLEAHASKATFLRANAQSEENNLPAIKYYAGLTEGLYIALGAMKGLDGEDDE